MSGDVWPTRMMNERISSAERVKPLTAPLRQRLINGAFGDWTRDAATHGRYDGDQDIFSILARRIRHHGDRIRPDLRSYRGRHHFGLARCWHHGLGRLLEDFEQPLGAAARQRTLLK